MKDILKRIGSQNLRLCAASLVLAVVFSMTALSLAGCGDSAGGGGNPTVISIKAVPGVTAPVTGAPPVTTITATGQYTGTVAWEPNDETFAARTAYTATITLKAKPGFTLTGVTANFFTVTGASATNDANSGSITAVFPATGAAVIVGPEYGISLSESGTRLLKPAVVSYEAQTPLTVTVTNTGSQPTGALTIAVGEPNNTTNFTLSATSISNIAVGGTATFTVTPKTGLTANYHNASIRVSGGNGISAYFSVLFIVNNSASEYGISLSQMGDYTFPAATAGYAAQTPKTVTVYNTGANATSQLTVTLGGTGANDFTLSPASINSIAANGSGTFTVTPKTGLAAGIHYAEIRVSGENVQATFNVLFPVNTAAGYGISLSANGTINLGTQDLGYTQVYDRTVVVTNTGSREMGALTIALSGSNPNDFTLSKTSINSLAANRQDTFTVVPKAGLAAGTHTATVTVSNTANGISASFDVSFTVRGPYGISFQYYNGTTWLPLTSELTLPSVLAGYGYRVQFISVAVINTGTNATGDLTAALSGTDVNKFNFGIDGSRPINSISVGGGIYDLSIGPGYNLPVGTYTATLTVSNTNISESFTVSFTVNPDTDADFGISLSQTETYVFTPVEIEYAAAPAALSVTVTNSGNRSTGTLTVALSGTGADNFTLSTTSIYDIAVGGNTSFTVRPKTGLGMATYTATVTVSNTAVGISESFDVSFTVNSSDPTYSISLSQTGPYAFADALPGYTTAPAAHSVTVTNSGNRSTGALTVALSGTGANNFTLSSTSITSIANGGTRTFTVRPQTGLAAGTHTATVTVSGDSNITSKTFDVSFTVSAATYGITLSQTGTYTFTAATFGYSTRPTALTVTVSNSGNQATGALTAALSGTNSGSFTLTSASISSIPAGTTTRTFTVQPNAGLAAGTHTATVTVSGSNSITANFTVSFTVNAAVINIKAVPGVTAPVTGATPVTAITATDQYTGTVSWNPNNTTFAGAAIYTATITLTAKTGYTLTGVTANFFTVAGATTVTHSANSGVITAVFPATATAVINIKAVPGVTAPVAGATPVTAITATDQYTGTVSWNGSPATFAGLTAYTATITLTAKTGYTLTGVTANSFTVTGATTVTHSANSGVITAVFPATAAAVINIKAVPGVTAPVTGATPVTAITATDQYTGTVTWNGSPATFATSTVYTATITLTAKTGYTLTGVTANFFTVAGATTVTHSANSGVITAVFPATPAPYNYIITGSGTSFTATRGGTTVGTANQTIQTVINAIRNNAGGNAASIQFGSGGANVLNIGTASAEFNNTGGTWGAVTLTGKITGSSYTATIGTIAVADAVSVTSTADITNSAQDFDGRAVYFNSTGTLAISSGTVSAAYGRAINNASGGTVTISGGTFQTEESQATVYNYSTGTVNISGGTVQTTRGQAVYNYSTGTVNISGGTVKATDDGEGTGGSAVANFNTGNVNISGGTVSATIGRAAYNNNTGKITVSGTANVTSAITNAAQGTIHLLGTVTGTAVRLEITGGTVTNTAAAGRAIYTINQGAVTISGGTVQATGTGGYAVYSTNASSMLTLGGNPTITGLIRPSAAGQLTAASGFAPGAKTYTLDYAAYAAGNVAVAGGSSFLSNFTLYNTSNKLEVSGSNLVIGVSYEYIITGSGTSFTATRGGSTVGTANQTISNVINAIRTDANSNAATIQFGNGTNTLDIGTASASFNNTGGTWGAVTLTGKITSSLSDSNSGSIIISSNPTSTSITSNADIANTGGSRAIYNSGTTAVNISSGTVSATTGSAVYNASTGTITVTVSGTANVTSANVTAASGTIVNAGGGNIQVRGGTVQNTATNGNAVYNTSGGVSVFDGGTVSATTGTAVYNNTSNGGVMIFGGTVSATTGNAVYNNSTGVVNISGGTVSATTGRAVYNASTATTTVSGTANVTSANTTSAEGTIVIASSGTATAVRLEVTGGTVRNTAAGNAIYNASTGAVTVSSGTVSATANNSTAIRNASTGALNISGGTVSSTGASGYAVYNNSTGAVNISGSTVSATTGIAVYNADTGKITVSGTANVTSANTATQGTIVIANSGTATAVRLEVTGGTVQNTASGANARAVYNASTGAVTVSGGTVSTTVTMSGDAVYNASTGAVNISGGTVSTISGGSPVYNASTGKITVSGTANVTSGGFAIFLYGTGVQLEITGGTVSSTGESGRAISNSSTGTVIMSGGTVQAMQTGGRAIFNGSTGTITISGGTVSGTGYSIYNASSGVITVTSPPAVINGPRYP